MSAALVYKNLGVSPENSPENLKVVKRTEKRKNGKKKSRTGGNKRTKENLEVIIKAAELVKDRSCKSGSKTANPVRRKQPRDSDQLVEAPRDDHVTCTLTNGAAPLSPAANEKKKRTPAAVDASQRPVKKRIVRVGDRLQIQELPSPTPDRIGVTSATRGCQVVDSQGIMTYSRLPEHLNGKVEAAKLFQWLIHPVKPDQFFKELWEKKPLLLKRHNSHYNEGWLSSRDFSNILKHNPIQFGTHLDLTSYRDGQRQNHNRPGRAFPALVWKHYREGGSIRMLNPQTYSEPVWRLLNTLQDFFRCTMGANVYLTPPGTQGFAPHYDDIEAFLIQLEGKKHWRVYAPRSEEETLPQYSSPNFKQHELGKQILDTVLEAGDLLYLPRGTVHQGACLPDSHSLHITVSTFQLTTWSDLLERLLPKALTVARAENVGFREGLPRDFLDYVGVSKSELDHPDRPSFMAKVQALMSQLIDYAPVDVAGDALGSRLLHNALPPNPSRTSLTPHHSDCLEGKTALPPKITPSSKVRLTTPYIARVIAHEDCVSLQHSASNSRLFHELDPQEIDYTVAYGEALEMLTNTYPNFIEVKALPLKTTTTVELIQELADMNIVQQKPVHKTPGILDSVRDTVSTRQPIIKSKERRGSLGDIKIRMTNGDQKTLESKKNNSLKRKLLNKTRSRTLER